MNNNKRSVLVVSPSHKCPIDFKVRGLLSERSVRTLRDGSLRVRVGNRSLGVVELSPHAPLRLVLPASAAVPGLRR